MMIKKLTSLFTIILTFTILSVTLADAKPRKHKRHYYKNQVTETYNYIQDERYANLNYNVSSKKTRYAAVDQQYGYASEGGRPSDCPKLWCGCWLSKYLFGENRRDLWSARAWLKFPRTSPRIGAVVVTARKGGGHVGVVVGFDSSGDPIIKSGNNAKAVRTGPIGRRHVLAYVQPT